MSLSFCAICNARDREIQEITEASSTCFGRRRRAQGGMRSRECSGPRMWLNLEVAGGWGGVFYPGCRCAHREQEPIL